MLGKHPERLDKLQRTLDLESCCHSGVAVVHLSHDKALVFEQGVVARTLKGVGGYQVAVLVNPGGVGTESGTGGWVDNWDHSVDFVDLIELHLVFYVN
jgi:hypothetical protein